MSLASYIPFTAARQKRKIRSNLKKYMGRYARQGDALGEVEYPDGKVVYVPVEWNSETDKWETPGGKMFFPRGKGGGPKMIAGSIPLVRLYAPNAGVISTEACLIAGAQETDQYESLDETGEPIEETEPAPTPEAGDDGLAEPVADGGVVGNGRVVEDHEADRRTDYPCDGVEIEFSDASEYDPYPVRQSDVRSAVDHARRAGSKQGKMLRYLGYGAAGAVAIVLLILGFIWLLGQIGSGSGAEGAGGGGGLPMSLSVTADLVGVMLA